MKIDNTRFSDPRYLADVFRRRDETTVAMRNLIELAVLHRLESLSDLTERDHVVQVLRQGIDNAADMDVTSIDMANGAYDEMVKEGLIAGATK
jgi:hypothetical protein